MTSLLGTAEINLAVIKENNIGAAINPLINTYEQLTKRLDAAFSDDVLTTYEKVQVASDLKEIDAQYDDITKTVKSYNNSSITGVYMSTKWHMIIYIRH